MHMALSEKWPQAGRYIQRISDECGGEGLAIALAGWCDMLFDHAVDGQDIAVNRAAGVSFGNAKTGELADESGVPDAIGWAGRLVRARSALDQPAWDALIEQLPPGGSTELADHIAAVLNLAATTMNGLPRGYALMGRGGVS